MNPNQEKNKLHEENQKKPIKSLRTYAGDVEEAILKNKFSSTDIFVAEQDKKRGLIESDGEKKGISVIKNKLYLIIGCVLLVLGILTIGTVYYIRVNEKIEYVQKNKTLVGFSAELILSVATTTGDILVTQILQEKELFSMPVNSVLYVNTVAGNDSPESIENVLNLLAPNMPQSLNRSFADKYMIGVFSFDTNEPFIILTTEDFALSYAGMLKWEKDIVRDVGKLFGIAQKNATSTQLVFKDEEIKNRDLRILKDNEGKSLILYTFIDSNTLLITKNENVFSAILGKYLISKQAK